MKVHPYIILEKFFKYILLIPLPIIPSIILEKNIWSLSTFIFISIGFIVWCQYKNCAYHISHKNIQTTKGICFKSTTHMKCKNIVFIKLQQNFISKHFSCTKIDLNANTKTGNFFDQTLFLSEQNADKILDIFISNEKETYTYKPPFRKILLMSLVWSNPLVGILMLIPAINIAAKALGNEIREKIYLGEKFKYELVQFGIPNTAAWISYILFVSWIFAFLCTYIKYKNLSLTRTQNYLIRKYGSINKTIEIMPVDHDNIKSIHIKQNLLMRMLKLKGLYFSAVGLKKKKSNRNVLIPVSTSQEIAYQIKMLKLNTCKTNDKS